MNKDILRRFFVGWSNKWEKKQVQEYFEGDDATVFDEYAREEEANAPKHAGADDAFKSSFFNDLTGRIQQLEAPVKEKRIRAFSPAMKVAASIILISSVGWLLYLGRSRQQETVADADLASISNTGRRIRVVKLKDGTTIWMTPGTTLRYDEKNFNDTARRISIDGEAYFDVAPDKGKPFRVMSGNIMTTVLGTSFNLEAYANEPDMRITLVSGAVQVHAAGEVSRLSPGQMLKYSVLDTSVNISMIDVSGKQELFTSGRLVFENVLLTDVFKRLERAYQIKIESTHPGLLFNKRISGAYQRNNVEVALDRILFIHGLHFKKKGDHAYVITN